ncbi:MAG: hypothetical protein ABW133_00595 [Polyangiaceae bacterium]
MTLWIRRWACRIADRHRAFALTAAALGIGGFVLSTLPLRWDPHNGAALFGALVSLAAYGLVLGIGHLGDPRELARREELVRAPVVYPRRVRLPARTRRRSALVTRSFI